jgi:hypothetical protein
MASYDINIMEVSEYYSNVAMKLEHVFKQAGIMCRADATT